MKTIILKLYDYIELDDEIKTKVAEEWYYHDGGDFVNCEIDNLVELYCDDIYKTTKLELNRGDFDFDKVGYITHVNLNSGELENSVFKDGYNADVLDKYVEAHTKSRRLKILLKNYNVWYYWNKDTERIEVDYIDSVDDSKYYEHCEKYLVAELPKILQPVSDKINGALIDFYHDLFLLENNIREYLSDEAINDSLNGNGWYFTKDGIFISLDEVKDIIDKLELVERAYDVKFEEVESGELSDEEN